MLTSKRSWQNQYDLSVCLITEEKKAKGHKQKGAGTVIVSKGEVEGWEDVVISRLLLEVLL